MAGLIKTVLALHHEEIPPHLHFKRPSPHIPWGDMLVKVFQGAGYGELRRAMLSQFGVLQVRKPAASRDRSAELYLLARGAR